MRQWDNDQCWVSSSDITKLYSGANCSPTVLKPFKVGKPLTPIVLKSWTVGNDLVAIFSCVIIIVNPHKKKKPSTIQRSTSVQRPSTLHWSSTVPYIADAILFFGRHKQVNQHQPFRIAESIRSVLLRPVTFLKTSTMPSTVLKLTNSSDIMY